MGKIFRIPDLAKRWGVSESTLRQRAIDQLPKRLRLPGSRLWMTREEDVIEFETQHTDPPPCSGPQPPTSQPKKRGPGRPSKAMIK